MRSIAFLPALMGLTAAVPYSDVAGAEGPAMAAAHWFGKRADNKATSTAAKCKTTPATACTSQPAGYGPTTSPDTVPNFMGNGQFSKAAAQAVTPSSYTQIFQNHDGSSTTNMYITAYNLQSYDTIACAAKCDQVSNCVAFNLYFERVPTVATDPDCCPNPKSMTTIRCELYGTALEKKTANNKGQWRNSFQVVVAGSNGYNKIGGTSTGSRATAPATTSSTKSATNAGISTAITSSTKSATNAGISSAITSSTKPVTTAGNSTATTSSAKFASTADDFTASSAAGLTTTSNTLPTTTDKVQDSSTVSSATPSIAANEKNFATAASSGTQSSSAPTASSVDPSSSASSSSSKTYLSNTDEVQPITGTEPGSPITATAATSSASTGCATPIATPAITFNLNKTTVYGEDIFMYGSIDQIGNWQVEKSYPMSAFYYTMDNTNWFATIDVPAGTYFEYKYFQRNRDYSISWANPPNMRYTVPTGCEKLIVVNDQWPGTEDQTPA